jgi:hypothetical protein
MTNGETPKKKPRCQFITKNGSRCHADPQTGKEWCFFHDPEQKKKQSEARKQGGEARARQAEPEITLPPNLPVLPLNSAGDVRVLLVETINHLRCRTMDLRAARAIGYLAGLQMRALKVNCSPVVMLMAETINQFRRHEIDLPTAKTFGMLASVMLCAVKREGEEQQAAALLEAKTPGESTRPPEATRVQAPRHDRIEDKIENVVTPIVAAQPPDDPKLHPAVINGAANANNASQPLSS